MKSNCLDQLQRTHELGWTSFIELLVYLTEVMDMRRRECGYTVLAGDRWRACWGDVFAAEDSETRSWDMHNFDGSFILSHKHKIILQKFTEPFLNTICTLSKNIKFFDLEMVRSGNDRILMQKNEWCNTPVTERSQWDSAEMRLRLQGSGSCSL